MNRTLKITEVMRITGLARSTIYNEISKGKFPLQIKLTTKSVGWLETDITEWLESRERTSK